MDPGAILVTLALLAGLAFLGYLLKGSGAKSPPPPPPPPAPVIDLRYGWLATPPQPSQPTPSPIVAEREVLLRRLGAEWVREQERVRQEVLRQEAALAARLRQAQSSVDFEVLRDMHTASRQTADHAKRLLDQARSTNTALGQAMSETHRAIEADRSRGGHATGALRRTLDSLHGDRGLIEGYIAKYKADLDRLNHQTGSLRDAIGIHCGPKGRQWYEALMKRTEARKRGAI